MQKSVPRGKDEKEHTDHGACERCGRKVSQRIKMVREHGKWVVCAGTRRGGHDFRNASRMRIVVHCKNAEHGYSDKCRQEHYGK